MELVLRNVTVSFTKRYIELKWPSNIIIRAKIDILFSEALFFLSLSAWCMYRLDTEKYFFRRKTY